MAKMGKKLTEQGKEMDVLFGILLRGTMKSRETSNDSDYQDGKVMGLIFAYHTLGLISYQDFRNLNCALTVLSHEGGY